MNYFDFRQRELDEWYVRCNETDRLKIVRISEEAHTRDQSNFDVKPSEWSSIELLLN